MMDVIETIFDALEWIVFIGSVINLFQISAIVRISFEEF